MNRLEKKFAELKNKGRDALIVFITAGYPDLETSYKLIIELERSDADVIELGVPFSDPMADGPVIQEASQVALKSGVTLKKIFTLVEKARKVSEIPICLMGYYNPIFCMGVENFCRFCSVSGVDGVIIPDLPPEEGKQLITRANKEGLDFVCLISPTTNVRRIKYLSKISRGFIYYVTLTGVTGSRAALAADLISKLKEIKSYTSKPVCAGFGISNALQVRKICRVADGAIIGSAVVDIIKKNIGSPLLIERVGNFVRSLKRSI